MRLGLMLLRQRCDFFVLKSRNSSHKWQNYQICTNLFYDATLFPLAKRFFILLLISIHIMWAEVLLRRRREILLFETTEQ